MPPAESGGVELTPPESVRSVPTVDDLVRLLRETASSPPGSSEPRRGFPPVKTPPVCTPPVFLPEKAGAGSRADLGSWDADTEFVTAAMLRLGLSARIGQRFPNILPGSSGEALIWCDDRGYHVYVDVDRSGPRSSYCLAEVFAAIHSGVLRACKGPEIARWKLRLLAETGAVEFAQVSLPSLPPHAPASDVKLRAAVELLFRTRWITEYRQPIPLTRGFLAAWTPMPESTVAHAKGRLIDRGVIVRAGETRANGHYMGLWLPGGRQ